MIELRLEWNGDIIKINDFDELLQLREISQYCLTDSFKGFCHNTTDSKTHVLFIEYQNPIGFLRLGTFITSFSQINIPKRD